LVFIHYVSITPEEFFLVNICKSNLFPFFSGHVPYVLVGAGTTAFAAAKAIREKDSQAKVRALSMDDKRMKQP